MTDPTTVLHRVLRATTARDPHRVQTATNALAAHLDAGGPPPGGVDLDAVVDAQHALVHTANGQAGHATAHDVVRLVAAALAGNATGLLAHGTALAAHLDLLAATDTAQAASTARTADPQGAPMPTQTPAHHDRRARHDGWGGDAA